MNAGMELAGDTRPRLEILRCPWELRDLLAELDEKHEHVELVRTVEPGDLEARNDPFWRLEREHRGIVLWIRIRGRFCPITFEGAHLMCTEITEYLARRAELLKREEQSRNELRKQPVDCGRCGAGQHGTML